MTRPSPRAWTVAPVGRASVKAPKVTPQDFRCTGNRTETPVSGIVEGKIITEHLTHDIPPQDGDKRPEPRAILSASR